MIAIRSKSAIGALALSATISASLSSCGMFADYGAIVEGNQLHERGRYEEAAVAYLAVSDSAYLPTVDYDLANVYARLGELAAAEPLWARAREVGDRGIAADALYNEGVALFEKERYEEAWFAFRSALSANGATGAPGSSGEQGSAGFAHDARINLELAWKAWKKKGSSSPRAFAAASRTLDGRDEEALRLLSRQETGTWSPGSASKDEGRGDDW